MTQLEQARALLEAHDSIVFAMLFGSLARNTANHWSDADIGIYVSRPWSLLEMGNLAASLETALGRTVDLCVLNVALERNPLLAYRVIAEGKLLFCRDPDIFAEVKARIILRYLDTSFLRTMLMNAFCERLESGQFGKGG